VHTRAMATVDLLLHPVRLRIVQAFLGNRELTTAQLAAELSDVPKSGLYRHLGVLADAGVLSVVGERRVRGTVERRYALRLENASVSADDIAGWSREEHVQAFATYVAGLLASFERYLSAGEPDLVRDGVSYSINALWLNDDEYSQFLREMSEVVLSRAGLAPGAGRRRRQIALSLMPLSESAAESETGDDQL